ncbi:hypothetical protein POVWA2_043740 [Plasmodium ovale wallikeri]|uniref:Uncharacterized protein n=1 Tax=Plasmodium ovale wallikeri TaxID=864142 RepID=A0A1A8ZEV0_PLAOA|nr:hypothetical protein POVWA1_045180 [Plasmodium ovale wallikeri]SBT42399.1 hypothetical protein POVWA2_043740 [Plasmodium ovale wallikeri]
MEFIAVASSPCTSAQRTEEKLLRLNRCVCVCLTKGNCGGGCCGALYASVHTGVRFCMRALHILPWYAYAYVCVLLKEVGIYVIGKLHPFPYCVTPFFTPSN